VYICEWCVCVMCVGVYMVYVVYVCVVVYMCGHEAQAGTTPADQVTNGVSGRAKAKEGCNHICRKRSCFWV